MSDEPQSIFRAVAAELWPVIRDEVTARTKRRVDAARWWAVRRLTGNGTVVLNAYMNEGTLEVREVDRAFIADSTFIGLDLSEIKRLASDLSAAIDAKSRRPAVGWEGTE